MDRLDMAISAFREVEPHAIINRAALFAAINAERDRILNLLPGGQICDPQIIADLIRQ